MMWPSNSESVVTRSISRRRPPGASSCRDRKDDDSFAGAAAGSRVAAAAVPGPLRAALPAAPGLLRTRHAPQRPGGCPCGTRCSRGAAVPDGRSGAHLPDRTDARSVQAPRSPNILEHLHCTVQPDDQR